MKQTKLFLLGAAILMLATSCQDLLDSISKNPVFTFSGTTVYDGQKAFLGTTAKCKIGWETDSPKIVSLSYNKETGKECVATFELPETAKKVTTVKITATNLDDKTVEPHVGEITVAPWKVVVYKKGSDNSWKKVDVTSSSFLTTSFSYNASGNGPGTYKLQIEYLDKDNNFKPITSIPYNLGKLENFKVRWSGKLGNIGDTTEEVCSKEIELPSLPASGSRMVAVYIGEVGHVVTLTN